MGSQLPSYNLQRCVGVASVIYSVVGVSSVIYSVMWVSSIIYSLVWVLFRVINWELDPKKVIKLTFAAKGFPPSPLPIPPLSLFPLPIPLPPTPTHPSPQRRNP